MRWWPISKRNADLERELQSAAKTRTAIEVILLTSSRLLRVFWFCPTWLRRSVLLGVTTSVRELLREAQRLRYLFDLRYVRIWW